MAIGVIVGDDGGGDDGDGGDGEGWDSGEGGGWDNGDGGGWDGGDGGDGDGGRDEKYGGDNRWGMGYGNGGWRTRGTMMGPLVA